jgi:hypothetical protein
MLDEGDEKRNIEEPKKVWKFPTTKGDSGCLIDLSTYNASDFRSEVSEESEHFSRHENLRAESK